MIWDDNLWGVIFRPFCEWGLDCLLSKLGEIKIKLRSFKSSEHINEKGDGPYHGFGY